MDLKKLEKELRSVFIEKKPEFTAYDILDSIEYKLFIREGILYRFRSHVLMFYIKILIF